MLSLVDGVTQSYYRNTEWECLVVEALRESQEEAVKMAWVCAQQDPSLYLPAFSYQDREARSNEQILITQGPEDKDGEIISS